IYGIGQGLDFTVNFNKAVTVDTSGGTPYIDIALDTGGTVRATYSSGSGTSSLVFGYAVASGELDTNGVTVSGNLVLNGSTIRDGSGNSADLVLNSMGSTAGVLVDSIPPVLAAGGGNLGFTESDPYTGNPPLAIDSGIALTAAGINTMGSATVAFAGGTYRSGEDVLSLASGNYGNITGSFNSSTGTLTLTSSGNTATATQWQAALDAVSYNDTAASPNTTTRQLNFTITDGYGLTSTPVAETLAVTHTDQSPVVTTSPG